jgi:predicted nuclease of predicted toxin-antitoxin system
MKLLFDQNLSHRLVAALNAEFPGSLHVRDLGMGAADDADIWDYARSNGKIVVSKDSDFQHRALVYGFPPKVIWLRVGNCPTAAIVTLLRNRIADVAAFSSDPTLSFLVLV